MCPVSLMMAACGMGITFMTDRAAGPAKGLASLVPLRDIPPCIRV